MKECSGSRDRNNTLPLCEVEEDLVVATAAESLALAGAAVNGGAGHLLPSHFVGNSRGCYAQDLVENRVGKRVAGIVVSVLGVAPSCGVRSMWRHIVGSSRATRHHAAHTSPADRKISCCPSLRKTSRRISRGRHAQSLISGGGVTSVFPFCRLRV
jgi:hypothetical protein